jgi:hypothetical protein
MSSVPAVIKFQTTLVDIYTVLFSVRRSFIFNSQRINSVWIVTFDLSIDKLTEWTDYCPCIVRYLGFHGEKEGIKGKIMTFSKI